MNLDYTWCNEKIIWISDGIQCRYFPNKNSKFRLKYKDEACSDTSNTSITRENMKDNIPEDLLWFLTETSTTISKPEREEPYIKIIEEPAKDSYKFRYESEGDTKGAIPGEKQQRGGKSFPKVATQGQQY